MENKTNILNFNRRLNSNRGTKMQNSRYSFYVTKTPISPVKNRDIFSTMSGKSMCIVNRNRVPRYQIQNPLLCQEQEWYDLYR